MRISLSRVFFILIVLLVVFGGGGVGYLFVTGDGHPPAQTVVHRVVMLSGSSGSSPQSVLPELPLSRH